jgi:cyclic pyranopterin phosphate synthase
MSDFTHLDEHGRARMVDVSEKQPTHRVARAGATVFADPGTIARIRDLTVAKGPVLEIARIAGIQAAKRTSDLIPLCHPLPIDGVEVDCKLGEDRVDIEATARCFARTGIEMEAMTAAAVAALTVYDMCKAIDRKMVLSDIRLLEKSGGRSGHFRREG